MTGLSPRVRGGEVGSYDQFIKFRFIPAVVRGGDWTKWLREVVLRFTPAYARRSKPESCNDDSSPRGRGGDRPVDHPRDACRVIPAGAEPSGPPLPP